MQRSKQASALADVVGKVMGHALVGEEGMVEDARPEVKIEAVRVPSQYRTVQEGISSSRNGQVLILEEGKVSWRGHTMSGKEQSRMLETWRMKALEDWEYEPADDYFKDQLYYDDYGKCYVELHPTRSTWLRYDPRFDIGACAPYMPSLYPVACTMQRVSYTLHTRCSGGGRSLGRCCADRRHFDVCRTRFGRNSFSRSKECLRFLAVDFGKTTSTVDSDEIFCCVCFSGTRLSTRRWSCLQSILH